MVLDALLNSPARIAIAEFLQLELFSFPFEFDLWVFVHFFIGMLIMFILISYNSEKKLGINRYWLLLILLSAYEIFEWIFFLTDSVFFIQESLFNSFILDIGIGMLGGLVWDKS